jgi:hypothetical protein
MDESGILVSKEIFKIAVEEIIGLFLAQGTMDHLAEGALVGRETGDEVFHIHPTAQANALQGDFLPLLVLDVGFVDLQESRVIRHKLILDKSAMVIFLPAIQEFIL